LRHLAYARCGAWHAMRFIGLREVLRDLGQGVEAS
jgi:hypothetical protein